MTIWPTTADCDLDVSNDPNETGAPLEKLRRNLGARTQVGIALAVSTGSLAVSAAWVIFGLWNSVAGLVVGVILLDLAIQGTLVSNQVNVYALRPEARSRLNTIFMGIMFSGGAAGSAAAALLWHTVGWPAVAAFGVVLGVLAATLQIKYLRN